MFISNKIINFQVEIVKRINYSVHHRQTKRASHAWLACLKKPLFDCPIRLKGNFKHSYCNLLNPLVALNKGFGAALQILPATCRVWLQCRIKE